MWYKNSFRRHLLDMHIDDWNPEFLSKLNISEYFENLKRAKIENAMIYLQSHVGLCYYPTKSGKMHNALVGKEDTMRRLADLCRENGITVTGYYSLIYNNWAHDNYPEWRMVDESGKSKRESNSNLYSTFAENDVFRYGLCCPNNPDYRKFVAEQIKEMAEYFTLDGMFFDMLFWPHTCYCRHCRKRWNDEVGGEIPKKDWNSSEWLLHMEKRREWMGEFAMWAAKLVKELMGGISVEHNFACAIVDDGTLAIAEPVNEASDYAGGDLYGGIYRQSFTCKFYRNITRNQPFEYMFSRCEPNLSKHTVTKSKDVMLSSVFLTTAHHGATLVIDAIDPIGTMDKRVYERLGEVFSETMPYEKYFGGDMIEDVGIYYSLKSKFNAHGEPYNIHTCAVNTMDTLVFNNVSCGVTGAYHDISKYNILIASCLTDQDDYDAERIAEYVRCGGNLYFSGGDNKKLMEIFFGAKFKGRTRENVVYIAPEYKYESEFEYFTKKYPLHFDGTAPIYECDTEPCAKLVLPYTAQDEMRFASIHSNPPGIKTEIPALLYKEFGKGKVIWSALPIEAIEHYDYRRIFMNLLRLFKADMTVESDAPKDIELVSFRDGSNIRISTVLLNSDYKARKTQEFTISAKSDVPPKAVRLLPNGEPISFEYKNGRVIFKTRELNIYNMYEIVF